MTLRFRDARPDDLDAIAAMNRMAGVSVAAIERDDLAGYFDAASYFRVAEVEGRLAGFLIGTDHSADRGNAGFRWFQQRHAEFAYIDRIVIAAPFRGHGLGRVFYADMISFAEVRVPVLGGQVSLEPRDDRSLLFHASLGFREVAQLTGAEGGRTGVMERALCSFPYVREHYLGTGSGSLPDLPWLAGRARQSPAAAPQARVA